MLEGGKRQEGREGWGGTERKGGKGLVKESSSRGTALALCPSPAGWQGGREARTKREDWYHTFSAYHTTRARLSSWGSYPGWHRCHSQSRALPSSPNHTHSRVTNHCLNARGKDTSPFFLFFFFFFLIILYKFPLWMRNIWVSMTN